MQIFEFESFLASLRHCFVPVSPDFTCKLEIEEIEAWQSSKWHHLTNCSPSAAAVHTRGAARVSLHNTTQMAAVSGPSPHHASVALLKTFLCPARAQDPCFLPFFIPHSEHSCNANIRHLFSVFLLKISAELDRA